VKIIFGDIKTLDVSEGLKLMDLSQYWYFLLGSNTLSLTALGLFDLFVFRYQYLFLVLSFLLLSLTTLM